MGHSVHRPGYSLRAQDDRELAGTVRSPPLKCGIAGPRLHTQLKALLSTDLTVLCLPHKRNHKTTISAIWHISRECLHSSFLVSHCSEFYFWGDKNYSYSQTTWLLHIYSNRHSLADRRYSLAEVDTAYMLGCAALAGTFPSRGEPPGRGLLPRCLLQCLAHFHQEGTSVWVSTSASMRAYWAFQFFVSWLIDLK